MNEEWLAKATIVANERIGQIDLPLFKSGARELTSQEKDWLRAYLGEYRRLKEEVK